VRIYKSYLWQATNLLIAAVVRHHTIQLKNLSFTQAKNKFKTEFFGGLSLRTPNLKELRLNLRLEEYAVDFFNVHLPCTKLDHLHIHVLDCWHDLDNPEEGESRIQEEKMHVKMSTTANNNGMPIIY
jgi:hypothetical protein